MENIENISNAKLRVLGLHSFRTSGKFLKKQIYRWDPSITEKLDLVFLDAPLPASGKSEIEELFPPPYFEWFQYNIDFTEYTNLDKAFSYIEEYIESNGPFDGILGFSQGATLASAIVGYQEKGLMLKNHGPIKFVIVISGTKFRDPKICNTLYSSKIECKSFQIIGQNDYLKIPSEELITAFDSSIVIYHPRGHLVPRLDEAATKKLKSFLEDLQCSQNECEVSSMKEKKSAEKALVIDPIM